MTTESTVAAAPTRMTGHQVVVLVVLLASQFMMAADFSIINVALPRVGSDLGFAAPDLQWIATTFALCAAGCTLVFGRVGDFVGRRRIFLCGMALLAASSLVGGLATSPAWLLVARTLQGLATAAVTPAALALLTTMFPEPGLRARALGLNSVMMSSGFIAGSILGGVLADLLSWRWAFFINVPVAVAALVAVPIVVTESRSSVRARLDVPGAVLITTGLFGLVFGITRIAETGPDAVGTTALLAGVVLLAAFWVVERRTADALVPVGILRTPDIALGAVSALFIFGGETALIFFTGLYVQDVLGLSPLATGLVLLGIGVGQVLAGVFGPRLLSVLPAHRLLAFALVGQGALVLPMIGMTADPVWLVPIVALQFVNGVCSMLAALAFMMITTSAVADDLQGMATGIATQSQQIGIAIGIPLLSAVFTASLSGDTAPTAQLDGMRLAIGVDAVLLVVAGLLIGLALERVRRRSGAVETVPA